MGETMGEQGTGDRFAGTAIVPEPEGDKARGRGRRIVPLPGKGSLRWYDPSEVKGSHWLEQLSTDTASTRRVHALARVYVFVSTIVLVVVLFSFNGPPPVATLALSFCCVLVAAYMAASSVRSLPVFRRRSSRRIEALPISSKGQGATATEIHRFRSSA